MASKLLDHISISIDMLYRTQELERSFPKHAGQLALQSSVKL